MGKQGRQCNQFVQMDTAPSVLYEHIYYDMYMVAYIYEGWQPKNTSNGVMSYM